MQYQLSLLLFIALVVFSGCQSESGSGGEPIGQETPVPVEELYPQPAVLDSPAVINGWVRYVNSKQDEFEQKGPYTIDREDGNYEVAAWIAGGEIIRLYVLKPSTRTQQWIYLNRYLIPMMREIGPLGETGDFYERRYYYLGTDSLMHARERVAESIDALEQVDWHHYEPEDELAADPEELRRSTIKFVQGK